MYICPLSPENAGSFKVPREGNRHVLGNHSTVQDRSKIRVRRGMFTFDLGAADKLELIRPNLCRLLEVITSNTQHSVTVKRLGA